MARDVRVAEQLSAVLEQRLGLALLEDLALAVGLLRMADVRERQLAAAGREELPQGERVAVVIGVVVGDDDSRGHGSHLPSLAQIDFAVMVAHSCQQRK